MLFFGGVNMDTWLAIIILLETIITLLILYGFTRESELILWEDKQISKIKNAWSRYRLRNNK